MSIGNGLNETGTLCVVADARECAMQVQTYDLDGRPDTIADLSSDEQAQLWLDSAPVLAVTLGGPTVMLTLPGRLVLLAFADYQRAFAYGNFTQV
jgi:hypothetical protein